jgi:hypothetical protein
MKEVKIGRQLTALVLHENLFVASRMKALSSGGVAAAPGTPGLRSRVAGAQTILGTRECPPDQDSWPSR